LAPACIRTVGEGEPDLQAVHRFDAYPLYWIGERFERWDLEHVDVDNPNVVAFIYGTCEVEIGTDGGCPPPLQIQIQPLCAHLAVVARADIWRRRRVRGAPVGTIDSAPVLFSDRVQIKVYRGQGSDRGLAIRALRALRSANDVEPVVGPGDPIPPAPPAVLAGAAPCSSQG
jgi:hypothetical protein